MLAEDQPALTVGLRGMAYWELRVEAANSDLHSGGYGGAVLNPITVLCEMLATLHRPDGHIAVPGFYDDVLELSSAQRSELAAVPFNAAEFLAAAGAVGFGEESYSTMERRTIRPTLEICGIWGGFQGEGAKTVIPARAGAKLSSRLVPNQDAAQVTRVVEEYLRQIVPAGIRMEFLPLSSGRWVLTPSHHPAVDAAAAALAHVWGKPSVFIREGGSIPPVASIAEELDVPCVLLGVGLHEDHAHAPNERVVLAQLFRGMRAVGWLWDRYGEMGRAALSAPTE
jgi:acetylornithine deacetylase/succinyl-diaminopimelate desuccinylase-like protein